MKPIHHEYVGPEGWVSPSHPLHPDHDEVTKKMKLTKTQKTILQIAVKMLREGKPVTLSPKKWR